MCFSQYYDLRINMISFVCVFDNIENTHIIYFSIT
jgi:hypothetical protein